MYLIHSRSYVEDISTLATAIIEVLKRLDFSSDVFMTMQLAKLEESNNNLTEAIDEDIEKSELSNKDMERDNAFRTLYYEARTKKMWHDDNIANAASIVMDVIEKYGMETIRLAYPIESAKINALLTDFNKAEIKTAIAQLPGFSSLIEQLHAQQQNFEVGHSSELDIKIEESKILSASRLKSLVRNQINSELMLYLNAMAKAQPEVFMVPNDKINALIEENNSRVRNRLKRNVKEKDIQN